jgi:hypothetical protein
LPWTPAFAGVTGKGLQGSQSKNFDFTQKCFT